MQAIQLILSLSYKEFIESEISHKSTILSIPKRKSTDSTDPRHPIKYKRMISDDKEKYSANPRRTSSKTI